jgi:RimJ/RimL family protein N-acetyltransferase
MWMILDHQLKFDGGWMRQLNADDVHSGYVQGLNDPDVNSYLEVKRYTQTSKSVIDFVNSNRDSSNAVLFGVWQEGREFHSGTVRLHGIDTDHRIANIGVCLFDKATWGKKIGSKAIASATGLALDYLKIRWVEACVLEENLASQKAFIAAGYDWIYDIPGKYLREGKPTVVKVYAARMGA